MKRILLLSFVCLLCLVHTCSSPVKVGQLGPAFTLNNIQGKSIASSELTGKVVLLHFWATWCPPCLVELPQLFKFVQNLDPKKVALLAVCVDKADPQKIKGFIGSWGYDVPAYLDPGGKLANKYGTYRYPETYILDQQGVVRKKIVGPADWTDRIWAQFLQELQ